MGIGLGILVGFFCNLIVAANSHSLDFRNEYEAISSAYGASVLLFGGLGLIVAFVIETNMKKKNDKVITFFSRCKFIFTCRRINFHQQATKVSSAGNKSSKPMKLFVYREERVGWSERFHSLISSLIVSFTDMMRVVRQALLPAKA